ncbi:MAG: hypothetical protein HUU28_07160 [Planctomycetaceae bacterium]|nr:hypothetical protein [Planctomycetaceae bacterium]
MNLTKATSRAAEIRASLQSTNADLAPARERLGVAIADGDESAAKSARAEIARLERLHTELSAALPIAERRVREAQAVEQEEQRRITEREANKNRKARVAAAKKVDAALATLAKVYREYLSVGRFGRPEDMSRAARRGRSALASAMHHACPEIADALEVRRIPSMHRQSLEAAQSFITEFAVEPEAEPA